ncbi:helix-turn-helix domain-containing protein [Streptomyces sp. NPDC007148]|uniref:helix-turn-helix domain-containing protein n=1 Tax=Streptomyces sp. NPDC007148 TaxID=3364775 RepID=UPI0036B9FCA2
MPTPYAKRLEGDERRQLAARARRLYESGYTIKQVGKEISRSFGCARQLLGEADTQLRRQGVRGWKPNH